MLFRCPGPRTQRGYEVTAAAPRKPERNSRPGPSSRGALRGSVAGKTAERRAELAEAALQTLSTLGYARTSLREIAQNSVFSHGVLHYYFTDKVDLITCCVRQYKARCVTRYDQITADATSYDDFERGFLASLAQTVRDEAPMHRLWYDLRSQSMFEESLREAVLQIDQTLEDMIWRVVGTYAELAGREPAMTPHVAYGLLDGLFQQALLGYLCDREGVLDDLRAQVHRLMPVLLAP